MKTGRAFELDDLTVLLGLDLAKPADEGDIPSEFSPDDPQTGPLIVRPDQQFACQSNAKKEHQR